MPVSPLTYLDNKSLTHSSMYRDDDKPSRTSPTGPGPAHRYVIRSPSFCVLYTILTALKGVSQSVMTLGQCMSPLITSTLFQFSIKSNLLGGNLIWAFLISICKFIQPLEYELNRDYSTIAALVASVHSFTLRASP